jgi:hypothetical protein
MKRHACEIARPVFCRLQIVKWQAYLLLVLHTEDVHVPGVILMNTHVDPFIDRAGKHEPFIVIGVLSYEVHPARRGKKQGLPAEQIIKLLVDGKDHK